MKTGYALHKIANERLAEVGLDPIRPQMVYNYLKKGYIKTADEAGLNEWLDRYIEKKLNRPTTEKGLLLEEVWAD